MVFNGIYPARDLKPTPCGLLSVADVLNHRHAITDERWIRGYDVEFISSPDVVRILSRFVAPVPNGTLYDAAGGAITFNNVTPFFIEVEDSQSAMQLLGQDRFTRVKQQLEAVTQKSVETELWSGPAVRTNTDLATTSLYFTKTGAALVMNPTAGVSVSRAISLAEQAISGSPTGSSGVIHVTRDIASLATADLLKYQQDEDGNWAAFTSLGTPVVVGSGYSGAGPDGAVGAAPTDTNKWIYVTGAVDVHLGKINVINESLAAGFNPARNDIDIRAVRPAAVDFDPSIFSAIRVTLPAAA